MKTQISRPLETVLKHRIPRILASLWLTLTLASDVSAQAAATESDPLPTGIHVVALENPGEALWWRSPEGMERISPSVQSLGPRLEAPGDRFELFRRLPDKKGEGFRHVPVGTARLLPEAAVQLVVVLPYDQRGASYPIKIFDHSLETHPPNHVRFINLAPKPLGVQIMDTRSIVRPGDSLLHAYPDAGLEKIRMQIAVEAPEGWQKLAYRRFIVAPGVRFLFLAAPLSVRSGFDQAETALVLQKFVD